MAKRAVPMVAVLMGSDSDLGVMSQAVDVLRGFDIPCLVDVVSAHRSPERCRRFGRSAARRGIRVVICGAGRAAHLAGVVASQTTLPVIGVPLDAGMNGLDALLSTAQMPAGVPVACMAVGKAGAVNAALLAIEILGLGDPALARRLERWREAKAAELSAKARRVRLGLSARRK